MESHFQKVFLQTDTGETFKLIHFANNRDQFHEA